MLDFLAIRTSTKSKRGEPPVITIYPEFLVRPSKDLMVRGGAFYAIWDEGKGMWSTNVQDAALMIDDELLRRQADFPDANTEVMLTRDFSTKKWSEFLSYVGSLPDWYHELDSKLTFQDDVVKKDDYVSKRLPYSMSRGACPAYDKLIGTLYEEDERQKLEWAVGAVVAGKSTEIQKLVVLYGSAGSGKSTFLNIVQMLFQGYYTIFDAKSLTSNSDAFALETFRDNPLVAVQHDGDLSRIEDNTRLNSIVSHEEMVVNEKRKNRYVTRFRSFLFMGTNKPVKITDARSGMVRRLIDVNPSGSTLPFDIYQELMSQVPFELGAIAGRCLRVFDRLGPEAYSMYRPRTMMSATNDFYNFVVDYAGVFKSMGEVVLKDAWNMYKQWVDESNSKFPMSQTAFKEELKEYFMTFKERAHFNDRWTRNVYSGFRWDKIGDDVLEDGPIASVPRRLELECVESIFDSEMASQPAQYANSSGTPSYRWSSVDTTLSEIDTHQLHFVKVPPNHVVIDFDIKSEDGSKDLEANLEAAAKWPDTYAELSKSGSGVHLHYNYDGDVSQLDPLYSENVEVKVFKGNSALRRKLTKCNTLSIATLSSGLPLKKGGKGKVIDFDGLRNEKAVRTLIERNLRKEIHPGTKPSIDFIKKILDEAYSSGMHYDVSDLRPSVMAFANGSTNHSLYCLRMVAEMKFHSDDAAQGSEWADSHILFYDVEVYPNLFVVVWKRQGGDSPVRMMNPAPADIEDLVKYRLVGFNNRRYDNHILYARMLGYSNEDLYKLSKKIIEGSRNALFREAYNLSYADVYDFSNKKQSLKKFEVALGIHHQEMGIPWDEPVDEELWDKVAEYCENDVLATEAVFNDRHEDFMARCLLSDLSGLRVNDTTRAHATRIIFGKDRTPQGKFVYTDLSEMFPGYKFDMGKSTYRGEETGEGGYVYAEPGMYEDVITLDIASMHPTSLIQLNLFGDEYTARFKELLDARLAIKHKEFDKARKMLGGKLTPYLRKPEDAEGLAYALKIIINSVYGFTSAKFDCEFRDPRNKDNIVAKRGALFMVDLKHAVQEKGYTVAHIKVDSIKIPSYDDEIVAFIQDFGRRYGYIFEVESVYDRFCLVNDAVYVAKERDGGWTATGAQFQVPYVFKKLFSHEPIDVIGDLCVVKEVKGASNMYLDMDEGLPEGEHSYRFVGKVGEFCPIRPGMGGGRLVRTMGDKHYSVQGAKGYRWLESETVRNLDMASAVDESYFEKLCDEARDTISKFGSFDRFAE